MQQQQQLPGFVITSSCLKIRLAPSAKWSDVQTSFSMDAVLSYVDDDGDVNTVRNQGELEGAAYFMRNKSAVTLSVVTKKVAPAVQTVAARPVKTTKAVAPKDRHEMLGKLLDMGFSSMQKNLIALKKCDLDFDRTVALLSTGQDAKQPRHLQQHEKHSLLGELAMLGFQDPRSNMKALKRSDWDLQEAVEILLQEEKEQPYSPYVQHGPNDNNLSLKK
jgi:hypothetical protein